MGRRPLPKRISPFLTRPLTLVSLWGISSPFELLSPSSGQVTNALLTRSPLGFLKSEDLIVLVRLACIRHAASVHPEPGSNSPYNLSFPCGNVHYGSLLLTCFTSYHSSIVKVRPSLFCKFPFKKPRCFCPLPGYSHRRSLSDLYSIVTGFFSDLPDKQAKSCSLFKARYLLYPHSFFVSSNWSI